MDQHLPLSRGTACGRWGDEKEPSQHVESETHARARISLAHEFARRAKDTEPSPTQRPLAADSGVSALPPASLKHTTAFLAVYRRGRWVRGIALSIGTLPNQERRTRIGLRTRRGLKGAVVRNRLKRQLRVLVSPRRLPLRQGLDVVIVIHPNSTPVPSSALERELRTLCHRANLLS